MPGTLRQAIWSALHVSGVTRPAPLRIAASTTGTAQRNGSLPKPRAWTVRPGALWTTIARCNKQDVAKSIQEKILQVRSLPGRPERPKRPWVTIYGTPPKATCSIWPSARTCSGACRTCTGTCGAPSRQGYLPRCRRLLRRVYKSGRVHGIAARTGDAPRCAAAAVQADQTH